jgi:hypothetical protein
MSENVCCTDAYARAIEASVVAVEPRPAEPGSAEPVAGGRSRRFRAADTYDTSVAAGGTRSPARCRQ